MWSVGLTVREQWLGAHADVHEWRAIYQAPQAVRERDRRIANRERAPRSIVEGAETLALAYRNTPEDCMESKA